MTALFRLILIVAGLVAVAHVEPARAQTQAPTEMTQLAPGQVLRGRFEQVRELQGFDTPLKSTGSFAVSPGQGLIWKTEKPFAISMAMSAAGFLQEVNGKETMQVPSTKLPFAAKLYDILGGALMGDLKALSTVFEITQHKEPGGWRVVMVPRKVDDPNMPLKSVTINGKRFIETVVMLKTNGDRERLIMLDQKLAGGALQADEAALLARAGKS